MVWRMGSEEKARRKEVLCKTGRMMAMVRSSKASCVFSCLLDVVVVEVNVVKSLICVGLAQRSDP